MNSLILSGNLGKDPEMTYTPDGKPVTKFSIAVSGYDFSKKEKTTMWMNIVAFGNTAENSYKFLAKGQSVIVRGRLDIRKYEGKDGVAREWVQCVAEEVEFGSKPSGGKKSDEYDPLDVPTEGSVL